MQSYMAPYEHFLLKAQTKQKYLTILYLSKMIHIIASPIA